MGRTCRLRKRKHLIKERQVPEGHLRSCPQHKIGFETKQKAREVVAKAKKIRGDELRPYKCPYCHLWHLTSQV